MEGIRDDLTIRALRLADGPRLTRIDHEITGRQRSAWYDGKLKRALEESDVRISLGAEKADVLVGAILGSLHYGEFGQPEPLAILDTILVDPAFSGQGIGTAMLEQLVKNLQAFGIERLRTEVSWDEHALGRFLGRLGFVPVPRLVLELAMSEPRDFGAAGNQRGDGRPDNPGAAS
jgi:ribosomal protein S18 acetylase RimI-like enzyme